MINTVDMSQENNPPKLQGNYCTNQPIMHVHLGNYRLNRESKIKSIKLPSAPCNYEVIKQFKKCVLRKRKNEFAVVIFKQHDN